MSTPSLLDSPTTESVLTGRSLNEPLAPPVPAVVFKRAGSHLVRWLMGLVVLGTAGGAGSWWYLQSLGFESSDDAFIDGPVVQVSPRISGQVVEVRIDDNQHVAAGDVLLEIDPRDYQIRVDQATAVLSGARAKQQSAQRDLDLTRKTAPALAEQEKQTVAWAEATLEAVKAEALRASTDLKRYETLFQSGGLTQSQLEQYRTAAQSTESTRLAAEKKVEEARARLRSADVAGEKIAKAESEVARAAAEIAQAEAALRQAQLDLSRTRILATQAGTITKKAVQPGNLVQPGQALLALVSDDKWAVANFKETQLEHMRPGQKVRIKVDAYPQLVLRGHLDSIQRGTGARFSLLPAENATGNYVKLVQRVPVKIVFDEPVPPDVTLSLGLSVVPTVSVR